MSANAPPVVLRLSLTDMMKLVVFAAAGSAAVAPIARLTWLGSATWWVVLQYALVAVPVTWAALAFVLIRRGRFREWFIAAVLSVACLAVVAICGGITWDFASQAASHGGLSMLLNRQIMTMMAVVWVTAAVLTVGLVFLLRRVIPARCPACERRRLLHGGRFTVSRGPFHASCLGCGAEFVRQGRVWRSPVESAVDHPSRSIRP